MTCQPIYYFVLIALVDGKWSYNVDRINLIKKSLWLIFLYNAGSVK